MFKAKLSVYMFIIISIFLLASFLGFLVIKKNIKENYLKDERIIFFRLKNLSSNLTDKLLYDFINQKNILISKHKEALRYLDNYESFDNINLDEIYTKLNKNEANKPYNIYLTNNNLIIKNTTFKTDLNFNLNFAKNIFDEHFKKGIIGISAPNFENTTKNFLSYSDSYIKNTKKILQISYTYQDTKKYFKKIKESISKNPNIASSTAYIVFKDGIIQNIIDTKNFKISKKQVKLNSEESLKLYKKLQKKEYLEEVFEKEKIRYKVLSFYQQSSIFPENKIIFSITFNQEELFEKIHNLEYTMLFLSFLGVLAIYYIFRIRDNELLLSQKDSFIEASIHEIKTPLSIISLNNELRDKKKASDKYSLKIKSAIKTLQISYDDMVFLLTKKKLSYKSENLSLKEMIQNRVEYFEQIILSQNRKIELKILNELFVKIPKIHLIRLLDNNLSNTLKYSEVGTTIEICLNKNILSFSTKGKEIENKIEIFKKYERGKLTGGGKWAWFKYCS